MSRRRQQFAADWHGPADRINNADGSTLPIIDVALLKAKCATSLCDFKIQGFVTCQEMGTYDDGSISAVCWTRRSGASGSVDLGAYLIREGLALAGPDAPFEYQALERIAQTNGLGVWGFQADQFRFR